LFLFLYWVREGAGKRKRERERHTHNERSSELFEKYSVLPIHTAKSPRRKVIPSFPLLCLPLFALGVSRAQKDGDRHHHKTCSPLTCTFALNKRTDRYIDTPRTRFLFPVLGLLC
ncbi:unnamed protein product, partial [Ectocarpus fasciculatus]